MNLSEHTSTDWTKWIAFNGFKVGLHWNAAVRRKKFWKRNFVAPVTPLHGCLQCGQNLLIIQGIRELYVMPIGKLPCIWALKRIVIALLRN